MEDAHEPASHLRGYEGGSPTSAMTLAEAAALLAEKLPHLQAVYLFGSVSAGRARADSDVDLAVLLPRPLGALERWTLQEAAAEALARDVDLVDLRAASDVLRVQVLAHGRVLLDAEPGARRAFEAYALSSYALLNEERAAILDDVQRRGSVYG